MDLFDRINKQIMDIEKATEKDIDSDALAVFKLQCDYVDIIIGNHDQGGRIDVGVGVKPDHRIGFNIRMTGKPDTNSEAFIMLKAFADNFSLTNVGKNEYKLSFIAGSYLKK